MLKRLITISLLLVLGALPVAGSVSRAGQGHEQMECCQEKEQSCSREMRDCQPVADCPVQCVCAASESPAPLGLLTVRPLLPSIQPPSLAALPLTAWQRTLQLALSLRADPSLDGSQTYLHHTSLRI